MSEVSEEDREKLLALIRVRYPFWEEGDDIDWDVAEDIAKHYYDGGLEIDEEKLVDKILAAGWRPAGVPAVDREKLVDDVSYVLSLLDECLPALSNRSTPRLDSIRGTILPRLSGVLRSEADVKAEALEEAAREFAPDLTDPAPGRVRPVYLVRAWLRSRAAVLRGDGNA